MSGCEIFERTYGPGLGLGADHGGICSGDIGDDCCSPDGGRTKDLVERCELSCLSSDSLQEHTVFVAETVAVSTASVIVVVPVLEAASKQLQASLMPSRPRSSLYSGRQLGAVREEDEEACLATRPMRLVMGQVY